MHISNLAARATRDEFRKVSVVSDLATGTIAGLGFASYTLALRALTTLGD